MSFTEVVELNRDLFFTALMVALPALAVSLLVGLLVSVFQTVTSLQDQTINYVPKVVLVGVAIVLTLGYTLQLAIEFTHRMFAHAAAVGQ